MRRLNNMLLNNQWITEEIKEEMKKYLEKNENKNTMRLEMNYREKNIKTQTHGG